jgi:hypothetical protein
MRKFSLVLLVLALTATACSGSSSTPIASGSDADRDVDLPADEIRLLSGLVPFDSCRSLLDHLQAEARERVGPYGLDIHGGGWFFDEVAVSDEGVAEEALSDFDTAGDGDATAAAPTAAGEDAATSGGSSGEVTGTNVQELGVDEPDLVKTDGNRVLVVSEGKLIHFDISDGGPVETGRIDIPEGWGHELFFQGDRVLLFTNGGSWGVLPVEPFTATDDAEAAFAAESDIVEPSWFGPASAILEIDISDPDDLELVATMRIQGQYLSARRVGNTVRMALTSPPTQLEWVYPSNPAGEDRAERFNRELIDETRIEDWIPEYEFITESGSESGPLLDCDRLHRPAEFSGFDIVSVLSFDITDGLDTGDGAGVLAGGETIYASTDRFYVATTKWAGQDIVEGDWDEWNESYTTDIHAFSIGDDTGDAASGADYVASGMVAGSLLNQFSMDEHDGYLRIITTDGSPWDEGNESETTLTVMAEKGDVLTPVGSVDGIGKGENLYSARLLDDVGFAVTFRQIDPFYVIDLSDPANPSIAGELKIPGFSTYLHPVDASRVLGIGQAATEEGRTTGLKVSLFDVSNPSEPLEVATWTMANANSPAEWDHRAFQYLAGDDIAIVPFTTYSGDADGAVLLEIGEETITEVGTVTHRRPEAEATSDCDIVDTTDFPEETDLFWIGQEGGRIQVCTSGDTGGYGSFYCEPIPVEEIRFWGPEDVMAEIITDLVGEDPEPGDRLELCWPDGGNWRSQIQRSFVVGDTLWTLSLAQLQSNSLAELDLIGLAAL